MGFLIKHINGAVFILLLGICFAVYGNSLKGEFILDDFQFTIRDEFYKPQALFQIWKEPASPFQEAPSGYRPIPALTWVLTMNLFGKNVVPYHITNILLHAITSFLVFVFARRLFGSTPAAIFAAFLFAVIPIHTENVANIKGRDDILAALFILAATILLQKGILSELKIKLLPIFASYFVFLLAVLSKELAIPAVIWFLIYFRIKSRASIVKTFVFGSGYFASIAVLFAARIAIFRGLNIVSNNFVYNPLVAADINTKIWTNAKIIAMYIVKTFVPYHLSAGYQYNQLTLVSNPLSSGLSLVGILFVLLFFALIFNKKYIKTPFGLTLLFFLFTFLPLPKILFQSSDIFAERWMYLPSAALCMIAGYVISKFFKKNLEVTLVLILLLLSLYSYKTVTRNTAWLTRKGFLDQLVIDAPNSAFARTLMARYYSEQGDQKRASQEAEVAKSIYPTYGRLRRVMGGIAGAEGKWEEAHRLLNVIPKAHPYLTEDHYLYAFVLFQLQKYGECTEYIKTRYGEKPPTNNLSFLLGICYLKAGDSRSAAEYIEKVEDSTNYRLKQFENE